nr:succinate--hydroxymethylglutarate CoA-transferase [Loxodonta africana]
MSEPAGVGDDTRTWGPSFVGTESTYFLSVNRNKKSIAVNIKNPKGVKIIKELAAVCVVFVENYVPGKLSEMGLGYDDIDKIAPHIVCCSIPGISTPHPHQMEIQFTQEWPGLILPLACMHMEPSWLD